MRLSVTFCLLTLSFVLSVYSAYFSLETVPDDFNDATPKFGLDDIDDDDENVADSAVTGTIVQISNGNDAFEAVRALEDRYTNMDPAEPILPAGKVLTKEEILEMEAMYYQYISTQDSFPAAVAPSRLMDAIGRDNMPYLRHLLENNEVDVNIIENEFSSALHYAAYMLDLESIDLLLHFGSLPLATNSKRRTALHIAVIYNFHEGVGRLIRAEPLALDMIDVEGKTPLEHIKDKDDPKFKAILEKYSIKYPESSANATAKWLRYEAAVVAATSRFGSWLMSIKPLGEMHPMMILDGPGIPVGWKYPHYGCAGNSPRHFVIADSRLLKMYLREAGKGINDLNENDQTMLDEAIQHLHSERYIDAIRMLTSMKANTTGLKDERCVMNNPNPIGYCFLASSGHIGALSVMKTIQKGFLPNQAEIITGKAEIFQGREYPYIPPFISVLMDKNFRTSLFGLLHAGIRPDPEDPASAPRLLSYLMLKPAWRKSDDLVEMSEEYIIGMITILIRRGFFSEMVNFDDSDEGRKFVEQAAKALKDFTEYRTTMIALLTMSFDEKAANIIADYFMADYDDQITFTDRNVVKKGDNRFFGRFLENAHLTSFEIIGLPR